MVREFPQFMLWLIDEGGYFSGVKLFDNFYGLQSIIDFSIVQSEDILGDTLMLRVSNLYSKLTTPASNALFDKTANKPIFISKIVNHKGKIGLNSIEPFSTVEGIWLFKNHEYEIVLDVDNTSQISQDMMGSMFLFFYDKELDELLKKGLK